ncbi:MAG: hypothetical protein ACI4UA_06955, partial [Bacteroidaceae bacterium]
GGTPHKTTDISQRNPFNPFNPSKSVLKRKHVLWRTALQAGVCGLGCNPGTPALRSGVLGYLKYCPPGSRVLRVAFLSFLAPECYPTGILRGQVVSRGEGYRQ